MPHNKISWLEISKMRFGYLEPIKEVPSYVSPSGRVNRKIECYCHKTGRTGISPLNGLMKGETKSGTKYPERLFAQCDDIHDYLRQFSWALDKNGYLKTTFRGKRGVLQQNIIWKALYGENSIPDGYCIDHIDNDPSNNKKSNLRLLTKQQNTIRRKHINGLPYKNVKINKSKGHTYYLAQIRLTIDGKKTTIKKSFTNEIQAALFVDNWWKNECPDSIKYEHDLPGNVAGRFIPYLNFQV